MEDRGRDKGGRGGEGGQQYRKMKEKSKCRGQDRKRKGNRKKEIIEWFLLLKEEIV